MKHRDVSFGEFDVVGRGSIQIDLKKGRPDAMFVNFKHHHHHPCNHNFDKLEYEISERLQKYHLIIKWDVSDIRKIVWEVIYW